MRFLSATAAVKDRKAALGGTHSYATLHGVAVDKHGNVFICDRLNKRVVVLDPKGKVVREAPVEHPDAIALSAKTGTLYLTTRTGDEHSGRGRVDLLTFTDWRKDSKPAAVIRVSETGYTDRHKCSHLAVCDTDEGVNVWVAYTEMPVRIYRDDGKELTLLKDFYRVEGAQRCLGFDRMEVDQKTDEVYLLDDHAGVWKVGDWKNPRFVKVPLKTASIAIDPRNRHVYARTLADESSSYSVGKVARFHLDKSDYPPANIGDTGTNRLTPMFHYEWCFTGNGDKGIAVAPNGNIAVVSDPKDGLRVFAGDAAKVPWEATTVAKLPDAAGGVRFDFQGIDNAGNEILHFGTYGNRDSTGGLPGVTVLQVMQEREPDRPVLFDFQRLDAPEEDVTGLFQRKPALEVVLLTSSGGKNTSIEGIVTQWDAARYPDDHSETRS